MQDRYTGDIGDFGKYGMLSRLVGEDLRLGVVWYRVIDEEDNADGKFVRYLEKTKKNLRLFRACNPKLYDSLKTIVDGNQRRVASIRKRGILPEDTCFYEVPLSYRNLFTGGARLNYRNSWVKGARVATKDCSLVFVDPDNGLEVPSTKIHHTKAPKFAFFDELTAFTGRRQSLVIYHHLNRTRKAQREFALRFDQIQKHFPDAQAPFGLWYHRGTARVFFIVPAKGHSARLRERAETLSGGAWGEHFERV